MSTEQVKEIIARRKYLADRIEAVTHESMQNEIRAKQYQTRCGASFDPDAKPESIARRAEAGLHWLRMQRLRAKLRRLQAARARAEAEAKALASIHATPCLKAVSA